MVLIKKKEFRDLERSKQKFIVSANTLSIVAFIFQVLNLGKAFLIIDSEVNDSFIICLSYLFNSYPFVLLFFYCKEIAVIYAAKLAKKPLILEHDARTITQKLPQFLLHAACSVAISHFRSQ